MDRSAWVDFVTLILQSYFETLLRYVLSATFCGEAVFKIMDQKSEKTLVFNKLEARFNAKVPFNGAFMD